MSAASWAQVRAARLQTRSETRELPQPRAARDAPRGLTRRAHPRPRAAPRGTRSQTAGRRSGAPGEAPGPAARATAGHTGPLARGDSTPQRFTPTKRGDVRGSTVRHSAPGRTGRAHAPREGPTQERERDACTAPGPGDQKLACGKQREGQLAARSAAWTAETPAGVRGRPRRQGWGETASTAAGKAD